MTDVKAPFPHDHFVKWVFTRPEAAAVELRQVLPPEVSARLDWPTLHVRPGSYIDPKLTARHSDILYAVRLRDDQPREALIYVLLEHQSSADRLMAWRLLRYVVRVWDGYVRDQTGPVVTLPLIIPIVLYQGPDGWTEPTRFSDLLDIPDDLRSAVGSPVELHFSVDELTDSVLADEHARDGVLALVEVARTLLRLAVNRDEITRERVAPLAPLFETVMTALGIDDVQALWTYVISAFEPDSPLRGILVDAASQELQSMYATIYDEAIGKGRIEGERKGKLEGERQMLLRLVDKRGLALTETQRERLLACTDEAQLQAWFDRALTADDVDAIFDGARR